MLELYKKRMSKMGKSMGEALRNQSNMIMNESFTNDTAYKQVKINGKLVDAKYKKHTEFSILKDYVDYYLQFRPGVHYSIGTYVDVPDDSGIYNTWLILGKTDDNQFINYLILQCNHMFRWVYDGKLHSCLGCIRSRNSYNSGVWTSDYSTTPENQIAAWMPTNDTVRTIRYNTRFMITDNKSYPIVYEVSKIEDMATKGVTKLTFGQKLYDPKRDNVDLMIGGYYQSSIPPVEEDSLSDVKIKSYSEKQEEKIFIKFKGIDKNLKCGGSFKTYTAQSIDDRPLSVTWSVKTPDDNCFDIVQDSSYLKIRAKKESHLNGKIIVVTATDSSGSSAFLELEVVPL